MLHTYKQYYSGPQHKNPTLFHASFSCKKAKKFLLLVPNHLKCNSELIGAGIIQDSRASRVVFHYSTGGSGHSAAFTNQSFLLTCSERTSQHTCSRINAAVSTHRQTLWRTCLRTKACREHPQGVSSLDTKTTNCVNDDDYLGLETHRLGIAEQVKG